MRGGNPLRAYQASAAAFLLLLIFATAFTGKPAQVGYHVECTDGIDNDGDNGIDSNDPQCLEYPFADGNGESHTPEADRFNDPVGYVSTIFDYWFEQLVDGVYAGDPCDLPAEVSAWYGPGNDGSGSQYDNFAIENQCF
jgi:hypothetical protein